MKVAIFVHDPDGDMGEGTIVGPFSSWESAERWRDNLQRPDLECIITTFVGVRKGPISIADDPYLSSP